MRCFIVCCLVALAVCQSFTHAIHLNQRQIYQYFYEAEVTVGATSEKIPASAWKLSSRVKITGDSGTKYFIQFFDTRFEELNGWQGKDQYEPMTSVMTRLAGEFSKPFGFTYDQGVVSRLTAPPGVSNTVINLCRGALDLLAFKVKNDWSYYELEEGSIYGTCRSNYIQRKNKTTNLMALKRVIDFQSCSSRKVFTSGMALAVPNTLTRMAGQSISTTVHYDYILDNERADPVIKVASAVEIMLATPFNIKSGHLRSKAVKKLTLHEITEKYSDVVCDEMDNVGDLEFKFDNVDLNIPLVMQELAQPVEEAQRLIEKLAEEINATHISEEASVDYLKLYELYRNMNESAIEYLWSRNKGIAARRYLILNTIPESVDEKVLDFIMRRWKASEINEIESSQLVVLALNHVAATESVMAKAQILLRMILSRNEKLTWKATVLAYGSLVRRHSIVQTHCSRAHIEPLLALATELLQVAQYDETKVITVLKSLGNAGCPDSLKLLRRLFFHPMPGRVVTPRILFSALQSVRLIADIDKTAVQTFTRDVYMTWTLPTELRMLAVKQLLETRPSADMVTMLVQSLLYTPDEKLGIFAYSYLKSFSKSQTPDNLIFSSVASVAVSILSQRYEKVSANFNKAIRLDWFKDDLLMGQAASSFIMNTVGNKMPEHIIVSLSSWAFGRILPTLEMGFDLHGLSDLLESVGPDTLASILTKIKSNANRSITLSFYCHFFGQEVVYFDLSKESMAYIENLVLELLRGGQKFKVVKPVMVFEARYIQASTLGVQMELNKYYHSISKLDLQVDPPISPLHLNHTVLLGTRGSLGMEKRFWTFFGVNTKVFQCGAELRTNMSVFVPWNVRIIIEVEERKFSIKVPLPEHPLDIVKFSSKLLAIIRAVGSDAKEIEMFPWVVRDWESEQKCRGILNQVKVCWVSLSAGTEDVFKWPASLLYGSKWMMLRLLPDAQKNSTEIVAHVDLQPTQAQSIEAGVNLVEVIKSQDEKRASNCTAIPLFSVVVAAMKEKQVNAGWKFNGYKWEGKPSWQLSFILAEIVSSEHWMMCIDTSLPGISDALISTRFGKLCRPYKISLRSETHPAPGFLTSLSFFLNWGQLPDYILEKGKSAADLIPGVMFVNGFERLQKTNAAQEIGVFYIPSIHHHSHLLRIDLPKCTYEKENIFVLLRGLVGDKTYEILE